VGLDLAKHYEEFTDALLHGYRSESALKMLVKFGLGKNLNHVVGPGNLRTQVFELIEWADSEGRVGELFAEALERKPNNPKLKQLAAKLAAEVKLEHTALAEKVAPLANREFESPNADKVRAELAVSPSKGGLEAVVVGVSNLGGIDDSGQQVRGWRSRMRDSEQRICSIQGTRLGTGFLIGADRIMTNSHVVKASDSFSEFDVAFGFVEGVSREQLPKYHLVEELARSEPKEYDYAIFRINEVPRGELGYLKAKPLRFTEVRAPISILGHPGGGPLRFSFGVLFDQHSFLGRIAYTANTASGSSGSPVFTENWDLVALHHHGEKNINNHGIPMRSILKDLKEKGQADLFETA
jgi:hypothetical protein